MKDPRFKARIERTRHKAHRYRKRAMRRIQNDGWGRHIWRAAYRWEKRDGYREVHRENYPGSDVDTNLYAGTCVPKIFAPYLETQNGRWIERENYYLTQRNNRKYVRLEKIEHDRMKRMGQLDHLGRPLDLDWVSPLNLDYD